MTEAIQIQAVAYLARKHGLLRAGLPGGATTSQRPARKKRTCNLQEKTTWTPSVDNGRRLEEAEQRVGRQREQRNEGATVHFRLRKAQAGGNGHGSSTAKFRTTGVHYFFSDVAQLGVYMVSEDPQKDVPARSIGLTVRHGRMMASA